MLKHRKVERELQPKLKENYVGGPGSDDVFYKYKLDKSGHIKSYYRIIGKNTYKIATYEYKKK